VVRAVLRWAVAALLLLAAWALAVYGAYTAGMSVQR
jgi:hypothetical protein